MVLDSLSLEEKNDIVIFFKTDCLLIFSVPVFPELWKNLDLPSAAKATSSSRMRPSRTTAGFMSTHRKYPTFTPQTKERIVYFSASCFLWTTVTRVWTEWPTLGELINRYFSDAVDPCTSAPLIGQCLAVIIIKLLSVPQTSSYYEHDLCDSTRADFTW